MRQFLRRSARAVVGQAGQTVAGMLLLVAVARAVDPAVRGDFVLATLVSQLGGYLVTLGLPAAVMFTTSREPASRPALVGLSMIASLAAGVVLTALSPVILMLSAGDRPGVLLLLLGNIAMIWLIFASWFVYGLQRFLLAGTIRAVPIALGATGVAVVAFMGTPSLDVVYLLWATPHAAVGAVCAVVLVWRVGIRNPTRKQWATSVGYGMRSSVVQGSNLLALRFDQWLLGGLGSAASVGVYSVAAAISEIMLLVGRAVGLVVFVDAAAQNGGRRQFVHHMLVTLAAAIAGAAVLALVVGPVVHLLIGPRYGEAATLTRILLIGTPGLVIAGLMTNYIAGEGRPGRASIYNLVIVALTVSLDIVLIPQHGAVGAAWASTIGYSSGGMVVLFEVFLGNRWFAEPQASQG